jgi:hypothetical protein
MGLVNADQRKADKMLRAGARADQVDRLRKAALAAFGVELPDEYLAFLVRSNGLDYNGLVIYDCESSPEHRSSGAFWQGFVSANLIWRDNPANESLLVFGDSDMELYAYDLRSRSYCSVDKVAHDRVETYPSFGEMIDQALRSRL